MKRHTETRIDYCFIKSHLLLSVLYIDINKINFVVCKFIDVRGSYVLSNIYYLIIIGFAMFLGAWWTALNVALCGTWKVTRLAINYV